MRRWVRWLLVSGLVWGGGWPGGAARAAPVGGLTLTVNNTGDSGDLNLGDGVCDALFLAGEQCTLRAAIEELNAQGAAPAHRIEFNITGTGPFTLTPGTALPAISVPVVLDGSTQPGSACPAGTTPAVLQIVLDGTNAGADGVGLLLDAGSSGSSLGGLAVVNFGVAGIQVASDDNQVACTHVGLGADGVTPMPNGLYGIGVLGDDNLIGGSGAARWRNVVSGNGGIGVYVLPGGDQNDLNNNFIGTTADGLGAAGNLSGGVTLEGNHNVVNGLSGLPNVISGNGGYGVRISQGTGNVLLANFIGTGRNAVTPLPNGGNGVEILGGATGNHIGASLALAAAAGGGGLAGGNLIANNGGHGVVLDAAGAGNPVENRIYCNAIGGNGGLGIDLGNDGVDVNDAGDGDGGANGGQNYPLLAALTGSPIVTMTLASHSNTEYTIEFFRSPACDPSGHGEGLQYLTTRVVTTDANGQATQMVNLLAYVMPGNSVTATATDPDDNTSEFSNCVTLTALPKVIYLPLVGQ